MNDSFQASLITLLAVSVAIGLNPGCSAVAIAAIFGYRICTKVIEFKREAELNRTARERSEQTAKRTVIEEMVQQMYTDLEKIKAKQTLGDLKSAFAGSKNG